MALYDSIAAQYDATRGYPAEVQEQVGQMLREVSAERGFADARWLEIGAGSGRVGLPLAAMGTRYIGADESRAMLDLFADRLQQVNAPHANLTLADAKALPFADGGFDIGLAVHVFHLVGGWQRAVAEFRRVVQAGGLLLLGFDIAHSGTPHSEAQAAWGAILDAAGVPRMDGRESVGAAVVNHLAQQGSRVEHLNLLEWETQPTVAALLHDQRYGGFCRTRTLPDPDFDRYIEQWRDWLIARHGSLDATLRQRQTFEVYVLTLPLAACWLDYQSHSIYHSPFTIDHFRRVAMSGLIAEEARLAEDIGAYIEATAPALLDEHQERAAWGDGAFNAIALRLFEYQYQSSPAYAEYCQRRSISPQRIGHWRDIPPVAVSELQYFSPAAAMGKGLRGQPLKQHQLYLYLTALMPNLRAHLLPDMDDHDRLRIITVARSPEPDSEAVLVFSAAALRFADNDSASYTNNHLGVAATLSKAEAVGERVCLMGHAHAIAQFAEHCRSVGLSFRLNPRSRILYSGGLEHERGRMYALFERVFGISRLWCVRMYNPAPGGSQFYDSALRQRACGGEVYSDSDYLCGPPWVRVSLRSQAGGSQPLGMKSGYVTVCDLSNFSNLMVVQSADQGRLAPATSGGRERFALM